MLSVRGLYKGLRMVRNGARFIMSNHEAPLAFDEGEKRYFVHNSKAEKREPSQATSLEAVLRPRGRNAA
jgi:hypothetical protein